MAGTTSTTQIDTAFITAADSLCDTIIAKTFRAEGSAFPFKKFNPKKPDPATLKKVGAYYHRSLRVTEKVPDEMKALGEPTTDRRGWDHLRSYIDLFELLAVQQQALALKGDQKAFVKNVDQLKSVSGEMQTLFVANGFVSGTGCALLFS